MKFHLTTLLLGLVLVAPAAAQLRVAGTPARVDLLPTNVLESGGLGLQAASDSARSLGESDLMRPDAPVFYALSDGIAIYPGMRRESESSRLVFQEPVSVLSFHGPWMRVRTSAGEEGYVESTYLSNVWIRVVKSKKTVYVYRGEVLESAIPADMAYNFFADKQQRGGSLRPDHWRTPEGRFYVVALNPNSQFHRAWVLNYPTPEDADRGLEEGIISSAEHRQIKNASAERRPPPMGTALGGFIEIHGRGTGARTNWTRGCVAIPDAEIDRLWDIVRVGTPVVVEP